MVSAIPVLRLDPLASARSSNRPAPETGGTMTRAEIRKTRDGEVVPGFVELEVAVPA
jgi:hypothetical protein